MNNTRLLLAFALVCAAAALVEAQVDVLQVRNSADTIVKTWGGGTAIIKCLATLSCTYSGGALSVGVATDGSVTFANIGSGTNTNALVIGSGGSLTVSGTGTNNATHVKTVEHDYTGIASGDILTYDGSKIVDGKMGIGVNEQTGTSYTVLTGDRGKEVTFANAAEVAVTLPQAGSTGFEAGWYVVARNINSDGYAGVTITPTTSTIDGRSNLVLRAAESAVIISDGANYRVHSLFQSENRRRVYEFWTDWEITSLLTASTSGTGATTSLVDDPIGTGTAYGVQQFSTGTTSTGRSGRMATSTSGSTGNYFLFGTGAAVFESRIHIADLSSGSEEYILRIGFLDAIDADAVDGAYFEYNRLTSANWLTVTASNSSRTKTVSSTAVVEDAWITLRIDVNAAGTSVNYFVNDVSIGTNTLNIPTGAGRLTSYGMWIVKSAGSTARTFDCDYVYVKHSPNTPR